MEVFLAILIVALYFLPAIIASRRNHHDKNAVFLLNLLLGWTFIGWVLALVWSATGVRKSRQHAAGITVTLTEEQAGRLGLDAQNARE
jgi:hypothetical protein